MKKLVILFVLISVAFASFNNKTYAQKDFKGIISYSFTYEGNIEPAQMAILPKEIDFKVLNNKSLMELTQNGIPITIIRDGDKKIILTLMDIQMINKKIMLKTTSEEINKELEKLPASTIKYIDETKSIAGYTCKKGEMISKDEDGKEVVMPFYYTEEFGVGDRNFDGPYKDVKGTLMEYTEKQGEIIKKIVVTKVKKGKVSEKDFLIPTGYEEMSTEKFKEMLGG